jgi:hypothetical protein
MKRAVIHAHSATYPDPINVRRGDALHLVGRENSWDGHRWLWAIAADGREGWVPSDLPRCEHGHTTAAYDYSARELDVAPGSLVRVSKVSHGWAWCCNDRGLEGWIPLRVLSE